MTCKCYRAEKNFLGEIGLCWGTRERDACSCGGDKSKCDFYPTIHSDEKKPLTNADRIRAMTYEELADYFSELSCWPNARKEVCMGMANCEKCWLNWLQQEATE